MIDFFSKHFLLCIWTDVNKVRIFNLQSFVVNTMANSQSWQNPLISKPYFWVKETYLITIWSQKKNSWAYFDSKILAFTTSLQMCKSKTCYCFVMATKLQFFSCCSLDNLYTMYYSEEALHIFPYSFHNEMQYLLLSPDNWL